MKKKMNNNRKYKFTYIKTTVLTLFCCTLFVKGYTPFEKTGENYFHLMLNGQAVGTLGDRESAEELLAGCGVDDSYCKALLKVTDYFGTVTGFLSCIRFFACMGLKNMYPLILECLVNIIIILE